MDKINELFIYNSILINVYLKEYYNNNNKSSQAN